MIRIFLGNQLLVLFLLPLVIAGYIACNMYSVFFEFSDFIDFGLWGTYHQPDSFWMKFTSGGIVFINALLLNFLFNTNTFYERNSYIVSLLYVVLMSFYHSFYQIDGVLIAHFSLILALFQLFRLENNLDGRKIAFNAGFLAGLAASFHPPLIFSLPIVWLMITRIRPFILREILLASAGFVVPLVYGFIAVFFKEHKINWNFIETSVNYRQQQIIFLVSIGLLASSAFLGVIGIRIRNAKSSIRFRKLTSIIYLLLLVGIGLGTVEILFLDQYEWFSFGIISLCLFLPFSFFNRSTQVFATILFYATFLFSVAKFFI